MRNRVLIDIAFMILIYGIYFAAVDLIYTQEVVLGGEHPDYFPWIVLGVSLMANLTWYVIGEWGVRPNASVAVFYTAWFVLLALIVTAAALAAVFEPLTFLDVVSYPWLNFVGGLGAYYLASVLFSPNSAKFLIWPSKIVRNW